MFFAITISRLHSTPAAHRYQQYQVPVEVSLEPEEGSRVGLTQSWRSSMRVLDLINGKLFAFHRSDDVLLPCDVSTL